MESMYAILFSWAVYLSGYPPAPQPNIEFKPKQFFIDEACNGNPSCKVVGWYKGGNTIYVWDKLDTENSQVAASIVVHENVHYLQSMSGKPHETCRQIIDLEREAYGVQKEYLYRNGVLANGVGLTTISMSCIDK
jgi:hypothetical protein